MCGDNINSVHNMKYLQDDKAIIVAYCDRCKKRFYFRKYENRTDPRYFSVFKRDILQQGTNLYYKEYPKHLRVI